MIFFFFHKISNIEIFTFSEKKLIQKRKKYFKGKYNKWGKIYQSNYYNFCLYKILMENDSFSSIFLIFFLYRYIKFIQIDYNIQIDYFLEAVHKVFNYIMSVKTSNKDLYLRDNDGLKLFASDRSRQPSIK